jgi:hypothetical protein
MGEKKGWRGCKARSEAHYLELTLSMGVQTTTLAPVALHKPSKSQGRRGEEGKEKKGGRNVSVQPFPRSYASKRGREDGKTSILGKPHLSHEAKKKRIADAAKCEPAIAL